MIRHNIAIYSEFFAQVRLHSHSKELLASYIIWFIEAQTQTGGLLGDLNNYVMREPYTTFANNALVLDTKLITP